MEHGTGGDTHQPVGGRAVPEPAAREPAERDRAGRVREVARSDLGPRGGPARPAPRRGGRHPGLDLARPPPDRGRRLRLHAVLRRQRRGRALAGDADGVGDHGDRADAGGDQRARTTRTGTVWGRSNRWRWSGRCGSSTARARCSTRRLRFRATPAALRSRPDGRRRAVPPRAPLRARGDRAARDGGRGDRVGGLPGGALARRAGEGAERIDRRSRRVDARRRTWRTARGRSTSRCSRSGSTPTRATRPSWTRFYRKRFRPEFQPAFHGVGRDQAAQESRARRCRRSRCRSTSSRPTRRPTSSRRGPPRSPSAWGVLIQRADNYALAGVLFAVSLFFAGISTRLHSPTPAMVVLGLGYALFLGSVIWIATFPVSVSI